MLQYFDLNRRIQSARRHATLALDHPVPTAPPPHMSITSQVCMYLGTFLGVLFSSSVERYKMGQLISLQFSFGVCVVSAVIALVLVPVVYQKLQLDPAFPPIVRLGIFVQQGVFWQVLMNAVSKTLLS